jgi:hypothetical protein
LVVYQRITTSYVNIYDVPFGRNRVGRKDVRSALAEKSAQPFQEQLKGLVEKPLTVSQRRENTLKTFLLEVGIAGRNPQRVFAACNSFLHQAMQRIRLNVFI